MKIQAPFAILLCRFSDNDQNPYSLERYEQIFTIAGSGKWNMPDYFSVMSHGKLDLSGSKIFGWFKLPMKRSDYSGSGTNPAGRAALVTMAKQKATEEGVHLDEFHSVVIVFNVITDLFGGPNGAVCSDDGQMLKVSGLSPALLGQEMGHTFGLHHSKIDGSEDSYKDRYDVMSTLNANMVPHPIFTERNIRDGSPVFLIGPGLNAPNMDAMGWLDPIRTWTASSGMPVSTVIQLRPLHRIDLEGYLAARVGSYYIEFRMNEDWDAACAPAVLIHYFENGSSYLVRNDTGGIAFKAGDQITMPRSMSLLGSSHTIKVTAIDLENRIATIQVLVEQPEIPREWPIPGPYQMPWIKWSELENGLASLVITNGRPYYFPKQRGLNKLIENIAQINDRVLENLSPKLHAAVKIELLQHIKQLIDTEIVKTQFQQPLLPPDSVAEDRHRDPV